MSSPKIQDVDVGDGGGDNDVSGGSDEGVGGGKSDDRQGYG